MTETTTPTSVVFDHCVRVYKEMAEQSRWEKVDEDHEWFVYEGYLTKLFQSLQLSVPYYTKVMEVLKAMGCLEQIRRGGGNTPSRWRLVLPPEEESFNSFINVKRTGKGRLAKAEQELRSAHKRIGDLENRVGQMEGVVTTLWDFMQTSSVGSAT